MSCSKSICQSPREPLNNLSPCDTQAPTTTIPDGTCVQSCNINKDCNKSPCPIVPEAIAVVPTVCQLSKDNFCYGMEKGWAWLGWLVIWFIIFTVIFWLIFYSLQPYFVLNADGTDVDNAKVLLAALIVALILVIIIWLIKMLIIR